MADKEKQITPAPGAGDTNGAPESAAASGAPPTAPTAPTAPVVGASTAAPEVNLLEAAADSGLKKITIDNTNTDLDGQEVYVYSAADQVDFKFDDKNRHMGGKTAKVNRLDATIMEKQGKGKIVKSK